MPKRTPFLLTFLLLSLTLQTPTLAADVSLGTWHTTGSQLWRTVYPLHTTVLDGASELYYPHSSTYLTASYENPISPNHSLFIESGVVTNTTPNTGSDSDWDTSKSNALSYYGQFKTKDKGHFISVDFKHRTSNHTSIFYGYTYNMNHYSMADGLYSISNYVPVNQPLPNLNSYYNMIYQGPHIGIRHEVPVTHTLTAIGSFSYAPLMLAQGHGWWNLRNLSFDHTGTAQMIDTTIGLRYALPSKNTTINLGYRYQSRTLRNDVESFSSAISWSKATNVTQGYFFTGEKNF